MDVITSTEFRKTYAKLTKPTIVTVSGHPIGTWLPWEWVSPASYERAYEPIVSEVAIKYGEGTSVQSKRDELLRKINSR